jgi:hypothetical protein
MIQGFVDAALALSRAVIETGVDEAELKKLQINLPAEVFDRLATAMTGYVGMQRYIRPAAPAATGTIRIAGLKFIRTPL